MPIIGAGAGEGMLLMGMLMPMWYGMPGMGIMGRGPSIMPACMQEMLAKTLMRGQQCHCVPSNAYMLLHMCHRSALQHLMLVQGVSGSLMRGLACLR